MVRLAEVGLAWLEEVYHSLWGWVVKFPMLRIPASVTVDFLLSATPPAPPRPEDYQAPCHDDNELNL